MLGGMGGHAGGEGAGQVETEEGRENEDEEQMVPDGRSHQPTTIVEVFCGYLHVYTHT